MLIVSGLVPWLTPWAQALIDGYGLTVTSTFRSFTKQARLWRNRWRNPFPVKPPGESMHNYGRAFDVKASPEILAAAGATWQSWGGRWGAADPIHFEA